MGKLGASAMGLIKCPEIIMIGVMKEAPTTLRVCLLGGFSLHRQGRLLAPPASKKARMLLAYLLFHPDRDHERAFLAGLLWPDVPETIARRRLSHALWQVKQVCPAVEGTRTQIRLSAHHGCWVDAIAFLEAWERYQEDPSQLRALEEGVNLYRGPLLPGFYDDWVLLQRERLRDIYVQSLERLMMGYMQRGAYEDALVMAQRLLEEEPLHEEAYAQTMRLFALLGRRDEALALYDRLERLLDRELGTRPGLSLQLLAQQIREGMISPRVRSSPLFDTQASLPMVGREDIWAQIQGLIHDLRQGKGRVLVLRGETGIGKTRLLMDLAQYAQGWEMQVWSARAISDSSNAPYDLLRQAILPHLTPLMVEQLRLQLPPIWLAVLMQILPELQDWLPEPLPLPPLKHEEEHHRLHQALVRLLRVMAQRVPVVLMLDDLQWADKASLDALQRLAEETAGLGVLLVCSFRDDDPAYRRQFESFLTSLTHPPVLVRLSPLSPQETGQLVRMALGLEQPAYRFESRIYQVTQGHPLFILETLRALHEQGWLYRDSAGQWSTPWDATTEDYRELPLSSRLQELFSQRLGQITPLARTILQVMALTAGPVSLSFLQQVIQVSPETLVHGLEELIRYRMIQAEQGRYRLTHDSLAETVTQWLTAEERLNWHGRIAQALASMGDVSVSMLAYHFTQAQRWPEALAYHQRAAKQAQDMGAYRIALSHWDAAWEIGERLEVSPEVRFEIVQARELVLEVLGERARQEEDLQAMLVLAGEDVGRRAWAHLRRTYFLTATSRFSEGEEVARRALVLAEQGQDVDLRLRIMLAQNQIFIFSGRSGLALEQNDVMLQLAREHGDPLLLAQIYRERGNALLGLGRHDEARPEFERALKLFRAHHQPREEVETLHLMAILATEQGNYEEARALYDQELALAREIGFLLGEAKALINTGNLDYLAGRYYHALLRYDEAKALFTHLRYLRGIALSQFNRCAIVLDMLGADEDVLKEIEAGLRLAREVGDPIGVGQAKSQLAAYHYYAGDLSRAATYYREGLDILLANRQLWMAQQDLRALAQVKVEAGKPDEALTLLDQADALGEELGANQPDVFGLSVRALAYLRRGDLDEALRWSQQAMAWRHHGQGHLAAHVHAQVLQALGRDKEAALAIEEAWNLLQQALSDFPPDLKERSLQRIPAHRAIAQAYRRLSRVVHMQLPRGDAPLGRPLRPDEWVTVPWTVYAPEDERIGSKVERRRHQLKRLLREAEAQGAAPTVDDLAKALGVSRATIKRDVAALRQEGHVVRTRGARGDGQA